LALLRLCVLFAGATEDSSEVVATDGKGTATGLVDAMGIAAFVMIVTSGEILGCILLDNLVYGRSIFI